MEKRTPQQKFRDNHARYVEMIEGDRATVYDMVDFAQFTTGWMTESQWEMFMYGRYSKHLRSTDPAIKKKMYKVLEKWLTAE